MFDSRNVHANQASPTVCISIKTLCQRGAVGNHSSRLPQAWLVPWPQLWLCLHPPGCVLAACAAQQPQPILTPLRAANIGAEPGQLRLQTAT